MHRTQIDEERLRNYVDKTLEAEFQDKLLTGEVKINLNQQAYKQPSVKASKELKKELKSLNGQLKKYRKATHWMILVIINVTMIEEILSMLNMITRRSAEL